jgi:hypothetical protein
MKPLSDHLLRHVVKTITTTNKDDKQRMREQGRLPSTGMDCAEQESS